MFPTINRHTLLSAAFALLPGYMSAALINHNTQPKVYGGRI
ncbi:hypothetical protein [Psychromonas aquimarina]|nr:hypothetical protein [Psychromonas aquimarina]